MNFCRTGRAFAFAASIGVASLLTTAPSNAQITTHVWVHPVDGKDPNIAEEKDWIGDPDFKFKTLQSAIDVMLRHLIDDYDPVTNPEEHGIVYALPGLYGPHGAGSSGDVLPIFMRDRVHVVGLGARRCVIRGVGTLNKEVYWPLSASGQVGGGGIPLLVEALVAFEFANSSAGAPPTIPVAPPWYNHSVPGASPDVAEVLEGFTFEGGDVQVLVNQSASAPFENRHRISNCVFDMRHAWRLDPKEPTGPVVAGPYMGICMQKKATFYFAGQVVGYVDQKVLIAHNTFVFGRWGSFLQEPNDWIELSRPEAVGIIDVGNPNCSTGVGADPDDRVRGVANLCVVGNVFRTAPSVAAIKPYAMIGVAQNDTRVFVNGSPVQTNAFAPSRVGSTNGFFYSLPVNCVIVETVAANSENDLWNCQVSAAGPCNTLNPGCPAATIPAPAVSIWDGVTGVGVDPAFVGEYLTTDSSTTGVARGYRDWRILPGSPLENMAISPGAEYVTEANIAFSISANRELNLFAWWDGEHWGNPRIVDGAPDIGFDERHLLIMAGSWSNDSSSHNQPGYVHPNLIVNGAVRQIILPNSAGGVSLLTAGSQLRIYVRGETPVGPPSTGPAWINPPSSLANPPSLASLPLYYRTKFIAFDNNVPAGVPQGWTTSLTSPSAAGSYAPLNSVTNQQLAFRRIQLVDDECPAGGGGCSHIYFELQGVVYVDPLNVLLRSNLQAEYR